MSASPSPDSTPAARSVAIDALRGFDMIWILGAGTFVQEFVRLWPNALTALVDRQLDHVQWEGVHAYDLIYPLFIFLAGVSIVLSLDKARRTEPRRVLVTRILRRGLTLYVLNFFFNGGFWAPWPNMRVASGVLALIAAAYVIAALVYVFLADRLKLIVTVTAALLLGYWALLALAPFPDFRLDRPTVRALAEQAGSTEPAAIAALVPARTSGVYEEGRNFSNYVDYRLLPGRLHNGYYESEGLLSPIPGAAICLLGVLAARWLTLSSLTVSRRMGGLLLGGAVAIALGLLWSLEFPLVKKLWSSSFCLVAAGWSTLLLAVFHLVVDVWGWRRWCVPFVWIGMNPITLYLLSSLVSFPKIAERLAGGDIKAQLDHLRPGAGAAAGSLAAFLVVLLLARFLYQRRIFLRV